MKKLFVGCLLAGWVGILQAADPYPRNRDINIIHYQFRIVLNDQTDEISGDATVEVHFVGNPLSSFQLDLDSPSGNKGMTVTSVDSEGKPVTFTQQNDRLTLQLSTPAKRDEHRRFRIVYRGIPEDGLIISKNKHGDRTFFGDNWPNRAHYWLPTVDHPSDKATCEFIVTAPNDYQVVANGSKVEETDLNATVRLTHWKQTVPIPTKVMVIGVARFAVQYAGEVRGKSVQSWVFPQDREAGFYDYALAVPILTWMEERIGPFPYEKLANVQSKTRYGGMENASNIFYSEESVTGKRDSEDLLAHEIAHQWFGDSASEIDWYHVWLSEGFATYLTQLYREATYGRERLVTGMLDAKAKVLAYYQNTPNSSIVDTTIRDLNQLLSPNAYQKGAWVLHMLRHEVGDSTFWRGIKAYYRQYRDGNALSRDFQRVMEKASGKNLTPFFKQWLYRPGQPSLNGTWTYDAPAKKLVLQLQQAEDNGLPFRFPLEIGLYDTNNRLIRLEKVEVTQTSQAFTFPLPLVPASVKLDPNTWLLAEVQLHRK